MRRSLKVGRVFGFELALDWSWIFALVLATWTLVTIGGRVLPTLSDSGLTLAGLVAAVMVFASLAAHELVHASAVRALGLRVHKLTLFLFGGITDVERTPSSPRSELLGAAVAPLASATLGIACLVIVALLGGVPTFDANAKGAVTPSDVVTIALAWLGVVNVGIAVLNLLPAFPLDGGRFLRALIWRATGDVDRATRVAALGGLVLGSVLALAGVVAAFAIGGLGVAGGMWLVLVGWFLASSASRAYQGVLSQSALA